MNRKIIKNIKKIRTAKGLTQDFVADRLNITRSAYQKIEAGDSYAWAKYLDRLVDILDITPKDLFDDIEQFINKNNKAFDLNVIEYIEVLHQENKDIYEKLISVKDEQIAFLKNLLEER